MFERVALFLIVNIAVLMLLSITFSLLGIRGLLDEQGVNLNLQALLVYASVIGMGGSFISLALSKWMAKRAMGVQVIAEPRNDSEAWIFQTVSHQAQAAGIGMPEIVASAPVASAPYARSMCTAASRGTK